MNKLWGYIAAVAVLALLSACGPSGQPSDNRGARLEPIDSVSGVLPGASGGYGTLAVGFVSAIPVDRHPQRKISRFIDPSYEFEVAADGTFSVGLPPVVASPPVENTDSTAWACGQSGHTFVGTIYTHSNPVSEERNAWFNITGSYSWELEQSNAIAWYSPKDTNLKCQTERDRDFPATDLNLHLKAAWNAVTVQTGANDTWYFISGAPGDAQWVRMPLD